VSDPTVKTRFSRLIAYQARGWRLEQPEPGVLKWQTPAGRRYATTPTVYPV
jgi:hypothetical protein